MKTYIKWGVLLGLATSIGTQILTWLGLGLTNWFVMLTYIMVVLFVFMGLKNIKSENGGSLSFGRAFIAIAVIILVSRLIFQVYMYVYVHHIDPGWIAMVEEKWRLMMQEANVSEEVITQRMVGFRKAYEPLQMFSTELIKYGMPQYILGGIVALTMVIRGRKNKN
jgi:hypothetical protein